MDEDDIERALRELSLRHRVDLDKVRLVWKQIRSDDDERARLLRVERWISAHMSRMDLVRPSEAEISSALRDLSLAYRVDVDTVRDVWAQIGAEDSDAWAGLRRVERWISATAPRW